MNARIQELAGAAQQYAEYVTPQGLEWFDTFKQKFAELVVRECLLKIELEAAQYAEPTWALELVGDIKQHFGVQP